VLTDIFVYCPKGKKGGVLPGYVHYDLADFCKLIALPPPVAGLAKYVLSLSRP
jgi:hypothetical protein